MSDAAKRIYHVGRLNKQGDATFAFNIRHRDGGGIGLSSVKEPLTDEERSVLFAHFGMKLTARTGGKMDGGFWEGFIEREPGTEDHFLEAVHTLPEPFCLVSSED